jgi:hypothetical protein
MRLRICIWQKLSAIYTARFLHYIIPYILFWVLIAIYDPHYFINFALVRLILTFSVTNFFLGSNTIYWYFSHYFGFTHRFGYKIFTVFSPCPNWFSPVLIIFTKIPRRSAKWGGKSMLLLLYYTGGADSSPH